MKSRSGRAALMSVAVVVCAGLVATAAPAGAQAARPAAAPAAPAVSTADPRIEPPALGAVEPMPARRAYDSRQSTPLGAGAVRRVKVVPSTPGDSWVGAWVNVTVTRPTSSGYLTLWSGEGSRPVTSTLNYTAGQNVPNLAAVPLTASGEIAIYNGSTGATDVIVDVMARVGDGASVAPGSVRSITPFRALDTRVTRVKVPGRSHVDVPVTNRNGVPTTASGVALNVTAVAPPTTGWASVYAPTSARPTSSSTNWTATSTRATAVLSKVADGKVRFYNGSTSPTDFLVDVTGWVAPGSTSQRPTAVTLVEPQRLVDTRSGALYGPGSIIPLPTPPAHPAYHWPIYSITTTQGTGSGYLAYDDYPTSITNFERGTTTTSLSVFGGKGPRELPRIEVHSASVHVIVDLVGWVGPDVWLAGQTTTSTGSALNGIDVGTSAPSITPGKLGPLTQPFRTVLNGYWALHPTAGSQPLCAVQPYASGGPEDDLDWAPSCLGGNTTKPLTYAFPVGTRALGLNLAMPRAGTVTTTLLPSSSPPLAPYVLVRNVDSGRQSVVRALASSDGRIRVQGLEEGDYLVLRYDTNENYAFEWFGGLQAGTLTTPDLLARGAVTVHVTPGQRTDLGTKTLDLGGRISATTRDASVTGAVLVSEDGRPMFTRNLSPGLAFEHGGLRPGTYYLCTSACPTPSDGFGPIEVRAGETTTVEVTAP